MLEYADDTTPMTETMEELTTILTRARGESDNHELQMNVNTTK